MAVSGGDDFIADGVHGRGRSWSASGVVHDVGPMCINRLGAYAVALARGGVSQVGGGEHTQSALVIDGAEDGAERGWF